MLQICAATCTKALGLLGMATAQRGGHRGDYTFYKWDEAGVCIDPLPTPILTQWGQCIREFNYLRVKSGSLLALTLINSYSFF